MPPLTRYSSKFEEGQDPIAWLRCELPTWPHGPAVDGTWWATSPTHGVDGIRIVAPDPVELVERVRALERMLAMAAGWEGRLPIGRQLAGADVDASRAASPRVELALVPVGGGGGASSATMSVPLTVQKSKVSELSDPTGLGPPEGSSAIAQAKAKGYSGTPCTTCGSLDTRYSGTCLLCDNCGNTSGCS